jgi:hypothetical protein
MAYVVLEWTSSRIADSRRFVQVRIFATVLTSLDEIVVLVTPSA